MFDLRLMSRYSFENIAHSFVGEGEPATPFFLLTKKSSSSCGSTMKAVHTFQRDQSGPGGGIQKLDGNKYFLLHCNVVPNEDHRAIKNNEITLEKIQQKYQDLS